jgi:hypothetical protein
MVMVMVMVMVMMMMMMMMMMIIIIINCTIILEIIHHFKLHAASDITFPKISELSCNTPCIFPTTKIISPDLPSEINQITLRYY